MPKPAFHPEVFIDYVLSHGYGEPTEHGIEKGAEYMRDGMDYAEAAAEVVTLGLVSPDLGLLEANPTP